MCSEIGFLCNLFVFHRPMSFHSTSWICKRYLVGGATPDRTGPWPCPCKEYVSYKHIYNTYNIYIYIYLLYRILSYIVQYFLILSYTIRYYPILRLFRIFEASGCLEISQTNIKVFRQCMRVGQVILPTLGLCGGGACRISNPHC